MDKIINFFKKYSEPESWDNTGLLIECDSNLSKILLTIDLTPEVINECIENNIELVISYHPVIFHPIKSILKNSTVQLCISNNISVYSPHTILDPLMNSYLHSLIDNNFCEVSSNSLTVNDICNILLKYIPSRIINKRESNDINDDTSIFNEVNNTTNNNNNTNTNNNTTNNSSYNNTNNNTNNNTINNSSYNNNTTNNSSYNNNTNNNNILRICLAHNKNLNHIHKNLCVGVGSISKKFNIPDSIIVTGELSHHDLLYYKYNNCSVIMMEHSNSERIYLEILRNDLVNAGFDVIISKNDCDPVEYFLT